MAELSTQAQFTSQKLNEGAVTPNPGDADLHPTFLSPYQELVK